MFNKILFLSVIIMTFAFVSDNKAQKNENQQIPTLTYSELIQDKGNYLGKTIRVKAFWIYGFEWSFLCDGDCKGGQIKTWVEFIDEDDLCKGSKGKLKKGSNNFDNKAEIIFVGKLSSGSYGHFGAYDYQFTVSCVEKFKKLKVELK